MTKNHLTISKQTEKEAEDEVEKFDIMDENNADQDTDEKDEEFIVKMILKPTSNNGINYIQRPQNSKINKIIRGTKKDLKNRNDNETLTQMMRKKVIDDNKEEDVSNSKSFNQKISN